MTAQQTGAGNTTAICTRTSKEYKGVERISESQQTEDAQLLATAKNLGKILTISDPD